MKIGYRLEHVPKRKLSKDKKTYYKINYALIIFHPVSLTKTYIWLK